MNTFLTPKRKEGAASVIYPAARSRRRFGRGLMLAGIVWLLGLFPQPLPAQSPPGQESNARFLFLVDTSAATRRRAPAMLKAINNLMLSSMNAELRRGDSVGVWTFNEELHTGQFPLQLWTPEATEPVASNVVAFLKAQRYEKSSRFEVVQPAIEQLVRSSERLTVLLVSDGNENISGTPFDQQIRGVFQREFQKQRSARMPFITVLRSSRGKFVNAIVNLAPWPVEFPPFPALPKFAAPLKPVEPEPVHATNRPLIIIGKKPAPPEVTNSTTPIVVSEAAVTNTSPPVESKPAITPPALAPAVEVVRDPPTTDVPTPAAVTNLPSAETPPPATTPKPEPSPAVVLPVSTPPTTTAALVETPKPAPTPVTEPGTELPPVVLTAAPAGSNSETSQRLPEISSPMTNAPTPVALAVQPETAFSRIGLIGISLAILLLVGGLFLVMQRRSRAAAHASLITRSMDQDNKQ